MDEQNHARPDIDLDPVNFPEEVAEEVREHLGGGGGGGGFTHEDETSREHNLYEKPGMTPDFGMSQSRGGWQL